MVCRSNKTVIGCRVSFFSQQATRVSFAIVAITLTQLPWSSVAQEKLGLLLDVSPEMGFLVPQVRKEVRLLNESLAAAGREPVPLREFAGASLDQEGSLSVPARINALYQLRDFYESENLHGIYWITSLQGQQSGAGFFQLQEMLKAENRRLVIRNAWQEQVLAGRLWAASPPDPYADPLHEKHLGDDWFEVAEAGNGTIIRSWMLPPVEFRPRFGAPLWLTDRTMLRLLGASDRRIGMDVSWRTDLHQAFGLHFSPTEEIWPERVIGRQWLEKTALVPFLEDESRESRNQALFEELAARDSIAADLDRIPAKKLGVLFAFGFRQRDIEGFRAHTNRPIRDWKTQYFTDLTRIVTETREQARADADRADRVHLEELLSLKGRGSHDARPEAFAARIAELVRVHQVDALYLFTNGYTGDGEFGEFKIAEPVIARILREAGVNLYVRVPFEFGIPPLSLQQLALASGGAVFQGSADDPDWKMATPAAEWPEIPGTETTER